MNNVNNDIAKIHEIKGPIDLAWVTMTDGSKRFVAKGELPAQLVREHHAEIRNEGGKQL